MTPEQITAYWLALDNRKLFRADPAFDRELERRFGAAHADARAGAYDDWADVAIGSLALIILFDQISRNIHRGDAAMYAADDRARAIAKSAIARGFDREFPPADRAWFYMPLMHAENLADQEACVELCRQPGLEKTLPHAIEHADIIRRFGRFPHRNAVLGRPSTAAEREFLEQGGFSG